MIARNGLAALLLIASAFFSADRAHAAHGGPDAGGWSWADSNEAGIDTLTDVPSTWTTIMSPWQDEAVFAVPLSFPFRLYDVTSSTVWLSTNGWISLLDPAGQAVPLNPGIPDAATPNATLAFLWDNHDAGVLTYARYGSTPRGDVIEVYLWQPSSGLYMGGSIEFYRNGALKVVYHTDVGIGSSTVGIENGTGTQGTQLVRDGVVASGMKYAPEYAILFYPLVPGPACAGAPDISCPTPVSGTTLGGAASTSNYACSGLTFLGSEKAYHVQQGKSGPFRATLSGTGTRNMGLLLMREGCNPVGECVTGGGLTIDLPLLPKGSYSLVVEGATPADDGDFTLSVSINDGDCNKNGIPDACDIAIGTSGDCNEDGRPDECARCPVDVVFVMDTSGSMFPVAAALCDAIASTEAELAAEGIDFRSYVWGITDNGIACLTDNVVNQLGSAVPGPPPPSPPLDVLNHSESWAQATAVVAALFPWNPDGPHIVVPISDEGAFQGNPVNDPGDDRNAIWHAISVATANGVLVSPISPSIAPADVVKLAQDLAAGTGGTWFSQDSVPAGIGQAIVDIVRAACAGIGGTADAGPDVQVCIGTPITLDGSATAVVCPGAHEFRWLEGATEKCGWSSDPTCIVNPTTGTTYSLEVRCTDEPDCVYWDAMVVALEGGMPEALGNSLRAIKIGADVVMTWVSVPTGVTYNLYRGVQKGVWPAALQTGLGTNTGLADVPGPPNLYFYRVTGVDCSGLEGP